MSSTKTGIEWTDKTWNPTTGCNKVSPGCTYCYAEALTKRFKKGFPNGFELTLHNQRLDQPKHWRKPSLIFVNSMSDLFHEHIPVSFIQEVFSVIKQTPWHKYQILTKRHKRLLKLANQLEWHENIWLGVSVENQNYVHRIDYLRQVPASVRFLSCEPLLGNLNLNLDQIHWVIVGGESGNHYRPIKEKWIENIHQQCQIAQVPFFFKQWGGRTSKANGRLFQNQIWDEMPKAFASHF